MKAYSCHHFVLPLPPGHRFPMDKYRRLHERVAAAGSGFEVVEAPAASDADLLRVHTPDYVRGVVEGTLDPAAWRRVGFPWSPFAVERSRRSSNSRVAPRGPGTRCSCGPPPGAAAGSAMVSSHSDRETNVSRAVVTCQ